MSSRAAAFVFAVLLAGGICACGAQSIQRGRDLYSDGRYVEAAEVFERDEERIEGASLEDRAEYGLYRGATFYALGDLEHAQRWLSFSYDVSRSNRDALSEEQQRLLVRTLRACSEKLAALPPPARPGTKVASTAPEAPEPDLPDPEPAQDSGAVPH
jgi:hypothetical protein